MNLKSLLKKNTTILADGAMGTYFSQLTGLNSALCEKYNVISPDIIKKIHTDYIKSGAKLIRTNTFSANSFTLNISHNELNNILENGYKLASQCAADKAVVCADVSAIYNTDLTPDEILSEYKFITDTFISLGAKTFIFETLPDLQTVMPAIDYILSVRPDAEIIVSFTILPDGKTRSGTPLNAIINCIDQNSSKLCMVGLNCGCSAPQLLPHAAPFFSYIHSNTNLFTSVMPNAGYPTIENHRTVFTSTPEYFAEQTARFLPYGVAVAGGCCGTAPDYIRMLGTYIDSADKASAKIVPYIKPRPEKAPFSSQLHNNNFVIAAELDPPNTSDISKLLKAAEILKNCGVNIITVSDSPLGHAKMDPVLCSSKIKREIGIEVLPHICCRDRNINSLRSTLLGAHCEGIRAVLAVTGDPIAETDRGVIKPVFNIDSTRLMQLITQLNDDIFADSPIIIGGAYDPAPKKTEYSVRRVEKKLACGAGFVLTQPVFSDEAINSINLAREKGIKVLAGIMPMVSYRNACFMKNEVPGMNIPDEIVNKFRPDMTRDEAAETGIAIAAETAAKLRPYVDGFYFITPFNRAEMIKGVIDQIKDIL